VEPGGQLDMQQLLAAAAAMQTQLMNAQQELAETEVEGTAGGGLVTATVNGQGELVDLRISAAAIEAGDPEETAQTLSDLVLAAYRDACRAADDLQEEAMAPFVGMPDLSSITGIPGLPGMPGAAAGLPGMPGAAAGPLDAPSDRDAEDDDS
jgi:nucleoid-associated protein EbfC